MLFLSEFYFVNVKISFICFFIIIFIIYTKLMGKLKQGTVLKFYTQLKLTKYNHCKKSVYY